MRSKTFGDFDEFAESVMDIDCRMMLRNPERRVWSVSGVEVDTIDVQLGLLSSGNIAQGQLRPEGYMLYVPLTSGVEYVANGQVVEKDACVLMDPGCDFCFSTTEAHDWGAIFVPTKYISKTDESICFSDTSHGAQCRATLPNKQAVKMLRANIQQIFKTVAMSPEFESTTAGKNATRDFFENICSLVKCRTQHTPEEKGRPKTSRGEIIRRCLEFLDQQLLTSVRISELAAVAGVSERTLRTVFNEYYGIGPIQYLQLCNLHKVHRALKAARPEETTVSQILMDHGEWAFSRFASRYSRLFGELPSTTLRNSKH